MTGTAIQTKRRMGPENSATRTALLDAAEAVMREDGYAALSARSVAERAGLKHQLVYYYFRTMDDLLLAAYRRRTERILVRLEEALNAERPLHAFWEVFCDPFDAALSFEYMAMSNHNATIKAETVMFGEQIRTIEAEKLAERLKLKSPDKVVTPFAITVAITAIAHVLGFESALGISGGHKETRALVDWCLNQLEPESSKNS
jgi:AcrR family transcriptional regulator